MAATSFQQVTAMLVELNPQIFKKEVFCISSKGFNQRDAYRVMLRKYPDVMNIEQMCDARKVSTKTGYKLLHEDRPNPQVLWMQSLDDAEVCFSIVEAEQLGLNYQIALDDEECAKIGLESADEAKLLLILARKDGKGDITANTQAPIVLNPRTRKALQKIGLRVDVVFSNL